MDVTFYPYGEGLDALPIYGKKMTYHFKPKTNKKSEVKKERRTILNGAFSAVG